MQSCSCADLNFAVTVSDRVVLGLNRSSSNLAVPRVRFVYFLELAYENHEEINYIQSREPKYERSRRRR